MTFRVFRQFGHAGGKKQTSARSPETFRHKTLRLRGQVSPKGDRPRSCLQVGITGRGRARKGYQRMPEAHSSGDLADILHQ
ncbi:hypothetical protein QUB63_08660 [Microcoleus sp. ARI1-B5]|uniref:hypothetical protein n=1 Tax=unclassified Microcoleus TaxID=2642155 RepID=UPI002FD0CF03